MRNLFLVGREDVKKFMYRVSALLTLAVLCFSPALQADGSLVLRLTEGATSTTIFDNGAGDIAAATGQITFTGTVGSIALNITTGLSNAPGNAVSGATLDLTNLVFSSVGAPTDLTIELTDTDFTTPSGSNLELVSSSGLTSSTVSLGTGGFSVSSDFTSFADDSNAAFGTSVAAPTLTPTVNGLTDTSSQTVSLTGPFSLTSVLNVTVNGTGSATFTGNTAVVPEPATAVLLVVAAATVCSGRRRARA